MSMVEKLAELLAPPNVDVAAYRCEDCGLVFDADHVNCPECEGEIRRIEETPTPMFWAQLD